MSEDLWQAVQDRRAKNRHRYTGGSARSYHDGSPRVSRSLLSGLASCSVCGGSIIISGSKKRAQCYGCGHYRNRGRTVCPNSLLESVTVVDRRLLDEIERTVLTPKARKLTLERAADVVNDRLRNEPDRLPALAAELAQTKREVENLMRALETGRAPEIVLDRLNEKERKAKSLAGEIRAVESVSCLSSTDLRHVDMMLEESLNRFTGVMLDDVVRARRALSKLLVGRVLFTPTDSPDGKRTYRLEADLTLGGILPSAACSKVHVPDGIRTRVAGLKGRSPRPSWTTGTMEACSRQPPDTTGQRS